MKKRVKLEQGSDEWLRWRKEGLGASDAAAYFSGECKFKTRYQLWLEKTGQVESEDLSGNVAVGRGNEIEAYALREFMEEKGLTHLNFTPATFEMEEFDYLKASLDGYSESDNSLVEIKCPFTSEGETHQSALKGEVPRHYYLQMQHQFLVSGARKGYFVSWTSDSMAIVEVSPEFELMDQLHQKASEFWVLVQTNTQPELTEKDSLFQPELEIYLSSIKTLEDEVKDIKKVIEQRKKEVIELMKHSSIKTQNHSVKKIVRKGSVDYSRIPDMKDVNLDDYRKESSSYYKFS